MEESLWMLNEWEDRIESNRIVLSMGVEACENVYAERNWFKESKGVMGESTSTILY